jgi:AcrR family transcriptional regulator
MELPMPPGSKKRLSRADWIRPALAALEEKGVDGVKIVTIAKQIGATSGSFYWHFQGLQDLLMSLLDFWERELTDTIIAAGKEFGGPPEQRILNLMLQVIEHDAAVHDHAISVWARRDPQVRAVYERTIGKRFDFASWMFKKAGFSNRQANIRGRLMVAYLMGESSTMLKLNTKWRAVIRDEFDVLMRRDL